MRLRVRLYLFVPIFPTRLIFDLVASKVTAGLWLTLVHWRAASLHAARFSPALICCQKENRTHSVPEEETWGLQLSVSTPETNHQSVTAVAARYLVPTTPCLVEPRRSGCTPKRSRARVEPWNTLRPESFSSLEKSRRGSWCQDEVTSELCLIYVLRQYKCR